jgi:hypothetical protein
MQAGISSLQGQGGPPLHEQRPSTQVSPMSQAVPQPPQLLGSARTLRQPRPGQHICSIRHSSAPRQLQLPSKHPSDVLVSQMKPHQPQLERSPDVSTHVSMQQVYPAGQGMGQVSTTHCPSLHVLPPGQVIPQPPQL